ncbi:MAG TPA: molybdenum cofactor guanylyltransferase [Streptosporangiaceae bacterium]|nr:molybdenum cofactor guanylyltransferase [Streptosporangiaceae bacterium]
MNASDPQLDAIVLAGGTASRLGGGDKPALEVGGHSLLARVVLAAREAGAGRVVVVGPPRPELDALVVREEPQGAGPVAALRAGLGEVSAPWVAVLAADLPFLKGEHLAALLAAGCDAGTGAVLADDGGQAQWLVGCWRTERVRGAIGGYRGGSMRGLFGPLGPVMVRLPPDERGRPPWLDCDTPEDLRQARAWCSRETGAPDPVGGMSGDERA